MTAIVDFSDINHTYLGTLQNIVIQLIDILKNHKLELRLSTDKHRSYRLAKRGSRQINE